MYNPLDKSQAIANGIAVGAGVQAHRNGADVLQSFNTGMWWRAWWKSMSMGMVLFGIMFLYALTRHNGGHSDGWGYLAAQAVINTWVACVTYVSAINASYGFKRRWAWWKLYPLWRLVPNVARVWWYLSMLLPLWLMMWFRMHHAVEPGRWNWFS